MNTNTRCPTMRGDKLTPEDQKRVLAAYVHRYTGDHTPAWVTSILFPINFRDDADWLANTEFHVTANGRLDLRWRSCESHPTWPNGK